MQELQEREGRRRGGWRASSVWWRSKASAGAWVWVSADGRWQMRGQAGAMQGRMPVGRRRSK